MNCANHSDVHEVHVITGISHGLDNAHIVILFAKGRKVMMSTFYIEVLRQSNRKQIEDLFY